MLGHRDAAAVTGLALAWRQRSAGKAPTKRSRPASENSRIQSSTALQFYFIKNQILIAFRYYCYITTYPKDLGVLTTNQLPLLEIIILGSLQSFYIQSRNSQAIVGINILGQAIRCPILDSQSITTIIFIQPLLIRRLTTKLIKISFYLWSGIGSSFKSLLYVLCKALAYQQVQQLETYFYIILCIFI